MTISTEQRTSEQAMAEERVRELESQSADAHVELLELMNTIDEMLTQQSEKIDAVFELDAELTKARRALVEGTW
jgi:hypothetical protein